MEAPKEQRLPGDVQAVPAATGLPAEALGAPPGPRSVLAKVLSGALSGALLVLLFIAVIPVLANGSDVLDAVGQMRPLTVLVMLALALVIRGVLAEVYVVLIPGLSSGRSLVAREASSAVSNLVPGPSGTAAQFVILRSWGVRSDHFARATVSVSVATDVLVLAAPGLLVIPWAALGAPGAAGGAEHEGAIGVGAVVLSVVSVLAVAALARSERMATGIGGLGQRSVNPLRRLVGRPPVTTWPAQCAAVRRDAAAQLSARAIPFGACVVLGYVANGVLLALAVRACGVGGEQLPLSLALLLYSVGRISTLVSLTPGGVGVVEIAYIAVFVAVLGDAAHDGVVAGVLVYRALTYLLPIVTGAAAYAVWRFARRRERRVDVPPARAPARDRG